MVDKNNTLIVRNVSEQAHKNLRILAVLTNKLQGEVLSDALDLAISGRKELIFKSRDESQEHKNLKAEVERRKRN
tara:strand:+ start:141 stop:365 length:225 start_codon:yes stop_codon:yes gene_type:complete